MHLLNGTSTRKFSTLPHKTFLDGDLSIEARLPKSSPLQLRLEHGRSSPLSLPQLGVAFLQLALWRLRQSGTNQTSNPSSKDDEGIAANNIDFIIEAVEYAIEQPAAVPLRGHNMGIDEVLCGRAGLLWAILLLREYMADHIAGEGFEKLVAYVPQLIKAIVDAGNSEKGSDTAPEDDGAGCLSWPWINTYYALGAIHGSSGILSILLLTQWQEMSQYALNISSSITRLCRLCQKEKGHLPMSTPLLPSSSNRSLPLVQMCHGTPGLLLLLACARRNDEFFQEHWQKDWDETFAIGSQRVWEEGLVSKGGGICHGIAGNALPWILWVGAGRSNREDEKYLRYALAFSKEARETPPFGNGNKYRTPDHPYSLFEGLAGTVLVWTELSKVLQQLSQVQRVQYD